MPTRAEVLLKRAAALAAVLSLGGVGFGMSAGAAWSLWLGLLLLYLTGVFYGLSEMTRLYHRHRRRCRTCFEGAGPHLRWWIPRIALVLMVSVLPVLMLAPVMPGPR